MALTANIGNAFRKYLPKHPRQILVSDQDVTVFTIAHPKRLPWFASPLKAAGTNEHGQPVASESASFEALPSIEQDAAEKNGVQVHGHQKHHYIKRDDEPELRTAHESSVIQLFYDLFFVANLTTFTSVHEVNDGKSK